MYFKYTVLILAIFKTDIYILARKSVMQTKHKVTFEVDQDTLLNESGFIEDRNEVRTINGETSSALKCKCTEQKEIDVNLTPIPFQTYSNYKNIQGHSVHSNEIEEEPQEKLLDNNDTEKDNDTEDNPCNSHYSNIRRLKQISSAYPVLNDMKLGERDKIDLDILRRSLGLPVAPPKPKYTNVRLSINKALTRNLEILEDSYEHNVDVDFRRSLLEHAAHSRPTNFDWNTRSNGKRIYSEYPAVDSRRRSRPIE